MYLSILWGVWGGYRYRILRRVCEVSEVNRDGRSRTGTEARAHDAVQPETGETETASEEHRVTPPR